MNVTDELIDHLAQLAMLEFDAEEKRAIKADLERMIDFVQALEGIDTEGVEPMIHVHADRNVMRRDEVTENLDTADALKNAPDHDSMYFKVPRVVEDKSPDSGH